MQSFSTPSLPHYYTELLRPFLPAYLIIDYIFNLHSTLHHFLCISARSLSIYSQTLKRPVLRYLSPLSGNITTTLFPLPSLIATFIAAHMAAPDEVPASIPSFKASSLVVFSASLSVTGMTSSYIFVFRIPVRNPAPCLQLHASPAHRPKEQVNRLAQQQ